MKVRIQHINEGSFSTGFVSHSFDGTNGFSYTILPLAFNLQQKGNTTPNDKGVFKYYVGDYVEGECEYDNKDHQGIIKYLYNDPNTNKVKLVYVQDMKNQHIVPLKASTVKKISWKAEKPKIMNYFFKNQTDIVRN